MNGSICKKCVIKEQTFSTDFFIERAKKIHGDKYNYENSNYTNNRTKIEIICNKHGIFIQNPLNHIKGAGCPNCAIDNLFLNNDTFIERSINFHCNKYNYKNVNYINNLTKVEIICNKHGSFLQIPYYHIQGAGCPNCRNSKGEEKIFNWLIKHNILFKREKIFNDCKYNSFLYFDFYLPKHNLCIEFDGKQHYEPIEFFGGEEGFIETQKRDKIKNEYCVINNIKLIRIRYDENIEYKLNEFFKLN
jgi:very-short-patch-repair endonuclease